MNLEDKIAALEAENKRLKQQLKESDHLTSLAGELAGKARNIKQTLAVIKGSGMIRDGAFYYRGETNLSAKELVDRLKLDPDFSPHFTLPKSTGSDGGNPFKVGPSFNLSKQMELMKTNPSLAATLRTAAKN